MILTRPWDRLRDVKRLSFSARSRASRATGWDGEGRGVVVVERIDDGTIVFHERGHWTPGGGRPLAFRNAFRWTLDPAGTFLRLEHLRFGAARPVFLFDLVPAGAWALVSAEPHACRLDAYAARMEFGGGAIRVEWTVAGPHKEESIRYDYA